MLLAVLAALVSVALGAALALVPGLGGEGLGRVRTFALIAAITVVLGHLLPEAASALGPIALALVVLGVLLPTWIEDAVHRVAPLQVSGWFHAHAASEGDEDDEEAHGHAHAEAHGHAHAEAHGHAEAHAHAHGAHADEHAHGAHAAHGHGGHAHAHGARGSIGLEIGYAGLVLHHVGDGVALWEYGASARASLDVVLALAAHTIPVIAVVVIQFTALRDRRTALLRAAGLAGATIAGILLGALFPETLERFEPWIAALVAGLLLHVIAHDLGADPPRSALARALDLGTAALGAVLPLATTDGVDLRFARALWGVLVVNAPAILAGLVLGGVALCSRHGGRAFDSGRRALSDAQAIRASGGSALRTAFFALAVPALRLELLPLALGFLGLPFTLLWAAAALLVALGAAAVIAALGAHRPRLPRPRAVSTVDASLPRPLTAIDALFRHTGPWLLVGLLTAVYLEMSVPSAELAVLHSPLAALAIITVVALPTYLAAAGAVPLAAVLIAKGVPPGPLLALLLLGPMCHVVSMGWLGRAFGRRAALAGTAVLVALTWAVALAASALDPQRFGPGPFASGQLPASSVLSGVSLLALGLLALRALWRIGTRRWLAGLAVVNPREEAPAPAVD